jgi:hypothetical protein
MIPLWTIGWIFFGIEYRRVKRLQNTLMYRNSIKTDCSGYCAPETQSEINTKEIPLWAIFTLIITSVPFSGWLLARLFELELSELAQVLLEKYATLIGWIFFWIEYQRAKCLRNALNVYGGKGKFY